MVDIQTYPYGEFVDLSGHDGPVQSFSWRSSGFTLASTCKDKQLRVFDVRAAAVAQVICYISIYHTSQSACVRVM